MGVDVNDWVFSGRHFLTCPQDDFESFKESYIGFRRVW